MLNRKVCETCRKEKVAAWSEATWDEENRQSDFIGFKIKLNVKKSWYCPVVDRSSNNQNTVNKWSEVPKLCDYALEHLYLEEYK